MDIDGHIWPMSLNAAGAVLTSPEGRRGIALLVVLFVLFVIGGAFFGGTESAFSAMNRIRMKSKADDGDKRAKNAVFISSNFDKALTTLLIGNNITHIAAASVATLIATRLFGASDTVSLVCTVITTLVVFLFSEMIPKAFANDRSESAALFSAGFLRFLMKILSPVSAFFTLISSAFTKLFEHFIHREEEPSITEDELYDIIDTIEEEGVFNEEQGDLFKSALDFSDTHAADVMTMRGDITGIDASLPKDKILSIVQSSVHSRLPVYVGSIDNIIGIVHTRTYLREYMKNPRLNIRSKAVLMPAYRVKPDAMIDDLLEEMRQHKFYLAVVSDGDGKTLGLVTIEDFLEELVGEIWDEDDIVDKNFISLGGNRYQINTHMTLGEIGRRLERSPFPSENPMRPLLSVILEHFGSLPDEDDSFTLDGTEVSDFDINGQTVLSAVIHVPDEDTAKEGGVK